MGNKLNKIILESLSAPSEPKKTYYVQIEYVDYFKTYRNVSLIIDETNKIISTISGDTKLTILFDNYANNFVVNLKVYNDLYKLYEYLTKVKKVKLKYNLDRIISSKSLTSDYEYKLKEYNASKEMTDLEGNIKLDEYKGLLIGFGRYRIEFTDDYIEFTNGLTDISYFTGDTIEEFKEFLFNNKIVKDIQAYVRLLELMNSRKID